MGYIVRAEIHGKTRYGKRIFKTLRGAKASIKSPSGQMFIKTWNLKNVKPVLKKVRR